MAIKGWLVSKYLEIRDLMETKEKTAIRVLLVTRVSLAIKDLMATKDLRVIRGLMVTREKMEAKVQRGRKERLVYRA